MKVKYAVNLIVLSGHNPNLKLGLLFCILQSELLQLKRTTMVGILTLRVLPFGCDGTCSP